MLIGVKPQDSWLGDTSPHTGVLSLQEVQPEPEDASVPREGPPIPQGWFSPPTHKGSLREQNPHSKSPSRSMEGGEPGHAGPAWADHHGRSRRRRACWVGRGPGTPAVSPELTPQPCAACSLHFLGGAAPSHLDHFWSMSLCPHPRANSKKGIFVKTCELVSGL